MSDDSAAASLPSPPPQPLHASSNATTGASPSPTSETPRGSFSRPSSARAINPAPITTRVTPKVALATASSPPADHVLPSPGGGGPTSASYVVPPRPKPGRKPATDEPASKRKAQNRESQRAFRARKAAKLTEMQTHVENTEQRHRQELTEKMAAIGDKEVRIAQLEALVTQLREAEKRVAQERDFWKERCHQQEELARQMNSSRRNSVTSWGEKHAGFFQAKPPPSRQDSPARESMSVFTPVVSPQQAYDTPKTLDFGCGNCKANGPCACMEDMARFSTAAFMNAVPLPHTPVRASASGSPIKGVRVSPADAAVFAEREIDFTAQFSNKRLDAPHPSIAFLTQNNEPDSKCGFCTDDSNCLCRDASLQAMRTTNDDVISSPQPWSMTTPTEGRTPSSTPMAPGSCADCQRNPKQRAWCQRVAQLRTTASDYFGHSPVSRKSSMSSGLDPMEPRSDYQALPESTIGCSDTFKLLSGRIPTDPDSQDWSTLKPISPSRKYSAMEIDAAGVVATLSQTMGPLKPRKEDGTHADLVRIAQEHRSAGASPRVISEDEYSSSSGTVPLRRRPEWRPTHP